MKLIFIVCVFLFKISVVANTMPSGFNYDEPSIVFVHIGADFPEHFEIAVKQARLFNSCNIVIIANKRALLSAEGALQKYNVFSVACEELYKTSEHLEFIKNSTLDKYFRNGFWNNAKERFFYIQDFMNCYQIEHVIHLENDNMLYVDVSSLLPIFKEFYPGIGITLDNDSRCIPGFIYIVNAQKMNHLAQFLADFSSREKNDMENIASYYQKFGAPYAISLPIIMNSYVSEHELVSPSGHCVKNNQIYCRHEDDFRSMFDAAAIGQYLGGIDPRNGPSRPGFINESCVFNPSFLNYNWKFDSSGRKIPYAKYGDVELRINNLHIHSKRLKDFLSKDTGAV